MEAKNSIFAETFGEVPMIKVLDFFLTFDSFDYSKSQVAKELGISRITLDKLWTELVDKKIIVKTRVIGRAGMFKLNNENPRVKVLLELSFRLASAFTEEETEKSKRKIEA